MEQPEPFHAPAEHLVTHADADVRAATELLQMSMEGTYLAGSTNRPAMPRKSAVTTS